MARPQKFRHSREALTDPQIAAKLGGLVLDIEALRLKRQQIDDQIAAAFDAVDDAGFEKKFVRKTIALRAKEDGDRIEEEHGLEAYETAVEKGVSLLRTRREQNALPPHDAETGEIEEPHSSALPTVQADNAGEVAASPSASPAAIPDADVPAFLLKERPSLRPLCQDPTNCAGYGHKTCHRCLQAAGQSEAA